MGLGERNCPLDLGSCFLEEAMAVSTYGLVTSGKRVPECVCLCVWGQPRELLCSQDPAPPLLSPGHRGASSPASLTLFFSYLLKLQCSEHQAPLVLTAGSS